MSMSFYKLSSRTLDAPRVRDGHTWKASEAPPQYTLGEPGLLTPDTKYYWHVRAMDAKGVWGPWSNTFSFPARGAAYPLDVQVEWDEAKGFVLRDGIHPLRTETAVSVPLYVWIPLGRGSRIVALPDVVAVVFKPGHAVLPGHPEQHAGGDERIFDLDVGIWI